MARKLRPSELARQDQALATAAEHAKHSPQTMVVTTSYAKPGTRCEWCECTPGNVDPECAGCDEHAYYMIIFHSMDMDDMPVCPGHYPDLQKMMFDWFGNPTKTTGINILDRQ